mmetsp:Transcript_3506/g.7379  ORF Transcript_3506/g.7379 Transcript_3506/m.7379 type:complete len:219 (+) Transcript_3506:882-1538(+)
MLGLVCTRRLRSLNWGWCRSASSAPVPVVVVADEEEDDPAAAEMPGGIPFIKNSTATSGLPLDALRHARQSDSGKPSALRLLITSVGNSSSAAEDDSVVVADGAGAAAVVVVDAAVDAAAVGAAGAAAGFTSSFGAAGLGAAAAAAAVFFALAIITTKKSDGLILQLSIVASSLRTLPEWISFMLAAGSSDLVVSMTAFCYRDAMSCGGECRGTSGHS